MMGCVGLGYENWTNGHACVRYLGDVLVNVGEFLAFCCYLRIDVNDLLLDVRHEMYVHVHLTTHRSDRLTNIGNLICYYVIRVV